MRPILAEPNDPVEFILPKSIGSELLKEGAAQDANDLLASIAALSPLAADRLIYTTDVDTVAPAILTAFARTLLDDADAAAARTTLGAQADSLPAARVHHSVDQTLATNTSTLLAWDADAYDTGGIHDTATNNSRLTVQTAGIYAIGAAVGWGVNGTGSRWAELRINGSTIIASNITMGVSTAGTETRQSLVTDHVLAAGDYVEVVARQDSGGNLPVKAALAKTNFFIHYLGASP